MTRSDYYYMEQGSIIDNIMAYCTLSTMIKQQARVATPPQSNHAPKTTSQISAEKTPKKHRKNTEKVNISESRGVLDINYRAAYVR